MDQPSTRLGGNGRGLWGRTSAATPYHGLLIFVGQILLVLLVPLLDRGEHSAPLSLALAAVVMALLTLTLLGYHRLPLVMSAITTVAFLWAKMHLDANPATRAPAIAVLVVTYGVTVYLSVYYAFNAELRPSQRILCGAASFVMLGFLFTAIHGFIAVSGIGTYALDAKLEGSRTPRWVDFLWLSFSTLTTAGFGDMSPVGPWPCAVSTLEGLCGILYPATLIARIAALPASGESGKCW